MGDKWELSAPTEEAEVVLFLVLSAICTAISSHRDRMDQSWGLRGTVLTWPLGRLQSAAAPPALPCPSPHLTAVTALLSLKVIYQPAGLREQYIS